MTNILNNAKNCLDFFLRSHITLSRKNYRERAQDISEVLETGAQRDFYENLREKYGSNLEEKTTCRNFRLNVYCLNIFDKNLDKRRSERIKVLDIGSKNWAYVKSEYLFFKSFAKNIELNGIELDAYRMYTNFYNRYEVAKYYTKDLENTNYIAGDLMGHVGGYDYIIWLLPFVTEYPLVKWGLPVRYFKPLEMLKHAYGILNEGGEMLLVNQGEDEYQIQQRLVEKLSISNEFEYRTLGEIEDKFGIFKNKRFCSKIVK